jgi:hypothetical protein
MQKTSKNDDDGSGIDQIRILAIDSLADLRDRRSGPKGSIRWHRYTDICGIE